MYHIDLYRLENVERINEIGLDEILQDEYGIVMIEWGRKSDKINYIVTLYY